MKATETKMAKMIFTMWWDIDKALNLWKSVPSAIQLVLTDVALLIQNSAKINAPYMTWNLRSSITTDFNRIQQWFVVVWSPVAYARIREYVNYKNPQTKYYLERWYTENKEQIDWIIKKDLYQAL